MTDQPDLTAAWHDAQSSLPEGWALDSLRCASTGLEPSQRSEDWTAVAVGPAGEQREFRASDPMAALVGVTTAVRGPKP